MAYKIAGIDNRGTKDCPFGFVYLAKGKEVMGRLGFGSHAEDKNPLAIWPCNQTPHDLNWLTAARAREALAQAFPHLAKTEG